MPTRREPLTSYSYVDIDTEDRYLESAGKGVVVRNSLPKGGTYIAPKGERFGYRVFWTHIINETRTPLKLTINFPTDSFAILGSPESYFKVYLPSDTMTHEKQYLYDYGLSALKAFGDHNSNKPALLQRTINAKEEYLFYVAVLFHKAEGVIRTGLVLNGQQLSYRIKGIDPQSDVELIPCGEMFFKK
ncbi:MAG: hypothetical protein QM762_17070 [Chryseolinea sp.]